MNWEVAGVIVEAVGTIVVLGTLIYLAIQVRLARDETQVQSTYASVNLFANWRTHIIENPDVSELIAKANEGEPLSKAEEMRLSVFMDDFVITSFISHATSKKGHPLYALSAEVEYLVEFLEANPGMASHWERIREFMREWDPEYARKIEARINRTN